MNAHVFHVILHHEMSSFDRSVIVEMCPTNSIIHNVKRRDGKVKGP